MEVLNDKGENNIFESDITDSDTSNSDIVLQDGKNINQKEGDEGEISVNIGVNFEKNSQEIKNSKGNLLNLNINYYDNNFLQNNSCLF